MRGWIDRRRSVRPCVSGREGDYPYFAEIDAGLRRKHTATMPTTITLAGSNRLCAIAVENGATSAAGRLPSKSRLWLAPGTFATSRACMKAAIEAEPMTEPTVLVVL